MSAQRARSAVTADHRSIHPNLPGLPWWAAVVVAVTATIIGVAFDVGSGNKELTNSFAALYVLGCVAAALAVRQSGVFTAVIQPPLILFCAVPGAYWLFHGATFADIKTTLITCGYPLIERFPLMLFTAAGVLLIGMARWYFGAATRPASPKGGAANAGPGRPSIAEKLTTKLTAVFNRHPARAAAATASRRRRGADHSTTRSRGSSAAKRSDASDPIAERPRRRRPDPSRNGGGPPRRRRRPEADPARRDPPARTGRPFEPAEPPPRRRQPPRAASGVRNDASATHHPISRVRYRGAEPGDEPRADRR